MSLTCPTCRATYSKDTAYCPVDDTALLPDEAFANAEMDLEPGTMIGEYRIERKLGEGAFGAVYAGIQPLIGKRVAIKLLHKRMSSEPEVVARFIDEARAVNKIGHRNIIDVFSFGVFEGTRHYFIMEFCEGMTLGQLLQLKKRLTPTEALPILRGIADGLDAAHQAGVTHRDLKPDNVFLVRIKDNQYFPKLLDFGVAKLAKEDKSQHTATGIAIGTPRYMSPEQCRGKNVDFRSDIYSLGCVAHEMLTGRPVFEADSVVDLLFMHTTEPPPSMSSVFPGLPLELDAPILEMLAKRPSGRPNSAGAAVNALGEAIRLIRTNKPSIPPLNPASETADTVRAPMGNGPNLLGPDIARTIPNEPLRAGETLPQFDETIPATRKSLTDFDVKQAQTAQMAPDSGNTEIASAPPILSQVPATLASTPLAGAVVDHVPQIKIVGASEVARPGGGIRPPPSSTIGGVPRKNAAVGMAGIVALVVAGGLYLRRPNANLVGSTQESAVPSQTTKTVPPESSTITLRATVTPADARIYVDGRNVGPASSAIVLPRETKQHALRFEKKGYLAQTMYVTAEADKQIGPITLVAAPSASASASAAPLASASALASAKKAGPAASTKTAPTSSTKKTNKDLLRPKELGGTK